MKLWVFFISVSLFFLGGCTKLTENTPVTGTYIGLTQENLPGKKEFKQTYRGNIDILEVPLNWEEPFPADKILNSLHNQIHVIIRWEPWVWQDKDSITYNNILEGQWDDYLNEWISQVLVLRYPVFINLMPEPSNPELAWSPAYQNKTIKDYHSVYNYIVKKFKKENALNAIFIFSEHQKAFEENFPSDERFIDWIGIMEPDETVSTHNKQLLIYSDSPKLAEKLNARILMTSTLNKKLKNNPHFSPNPEKLNTLHLNSKK